MIVGIFAHLGLSMRIPSRTLTLLSIFSESLGC
jgi:hypothetical protein